MTDPVTNPTATATVTDPAIVALNAPPGGPTGAPAAVVPAAPAADILAPVDDKTRVPATPSDDGTITFEKTGDIGLDLALEYFGKLGIGPDSAEFDQASQGNFQYLEAKLAAMGDKAKGWEQYVALGKEAHTRAEAKSKEEFAKLEKTVHEAVGGEDTWKALKQFATTTMKPEQLTELKAALNTGGLVAVATAQYLHRAALASQGTTVPGAAAVIADANPSAQLANLQPLTREAWRAEYKAGVAKHGINGFAKTPEYAALQQRFPR